MKTFIHYIVFFGFFVLTFTLKADWVQQFSGTTENLFYVNFLDINTGYVVGSNGKILKTTNAGMNWYSLNSGVTAVLKSVYFINGLTGIVAGYNGTILRTTNSGATWQATNIIQKDFETILFLDNNTGFIAGNGASLLKTTNAGLNWINLTPAPSSDQPSYNSSFKVSSTIAYLGAQQSGSHQQGARTIYKTTNSGLNWEPTYFTTGGGIYSIAFGSNNIGFAQSNGYMYRTSDGGNNWQEINGLFPGGNSVSMLNQNLGYRVFNSTILYSTNSGMNWISDFTSVSTFFQCIQFINQSNAVAVGSFGGIYRNSAVALNIQHIGTEVPKEFSLFQNYPNPFNPVTKINFDIPHSGLVVLKVYDVNANELTALVNSELNAGKYSVDFNASLFSSGIYFCKISFDGHTFTKKMILVK